MNKRTVALIILIFVTACLTAVHSDPADRLKRSYDPKSVKVTRWLDTTTRPITYEEYIKSRDFAPSPNIRQLRSPLVTTDGVIDVIVNENLYVHIEDVLDTFIIDLQIEGYDINLYTARETSSPVSLRELLRDDLFNLDIVGVIFIGDLAVPWYEMDEPESWGGQHVEFPCDLYFMDLDGAWGDWDFNGMFDSHTGNMLADIWTGRLVASPMQYYGDTEISIMTNYFNKNHSYRNGNLRLDDHGLAFIDNDWNSYGWGYDVALAYPDMDSLVDIYETCRANYIHYLRELTDNRYEHLLICSHSSPFAHYIFYDANNYQLFRNYEIEYFMMQALSYNLFACSNSRYVEIDNMGGWYIFESNYGLLSVGSTKTGSMLCFDTFYWPLGEGASFGEAFLLWAQLNMETCAGDESRPWFYGMCVQGDPTLKLARFQAPLTYCTYVPGDINGDSTVSGNDVVYGVRYFKGLGTPPIDSCWDDSLSVWLYVAGDVNGNCSFTGADVSYMVGYFKGYNPDILYCPRLPPYSVPGRPAILDRERAIQTVK
jgi:hypothetical protein